jgi:hypothetical protein
MAGLDLLIIAVDSEIDRMKTTVVSLTGIIKCVHEKRIADQTDIYKFRDFRDLFLIGLNT